MPHSHIPLIILCFHEWTFCLQTIFLTLPKLTCMIDDEWIQPHIFSQKDSKWLTEPAVMTLPLENHSRDLSNASPGTWKFKGQRKDIFYRCWTVLIWTKMCLLSSVFWWFPILYRKCDNPLNTCKLVSEFHIFINLNLIFLFWCSRYFQFSI